MSETEAEAVVVGGGTGLAAALAALSHGCSVELIERNPKLGGSTAWSMGVPPARRFRPAGSQRGHLVASKPPASRVDMIVRLRREYGMTGRSDITVGTTPVADGRRAFATVFR